MSLAHSNFTLSLTVIYTTFSYLLKLASDFFFFFVNLCCISLVAPLVKNLPAMQDTLVWFLGREDSLEKGKATQLQYSGLENSMACIVHGSPESDTTEQLSFSFIQHSLAMCHKSKCLSTAFNYWCVSLSGKVQESVSCLVVPSSLQPHGW